MGMTPGKARQRPHNGEHRVPIRPEPFPTALVPTSSTRWPPAWASNRRRPSTNSRRRTGGTAAAEDGRSSVGPYRACGPSEGRPSPPYQQRTASRSSCLSGAICLAASTSGRARPYVRAASVFGRRNPPRTFASPLSARRPVEQIPLDAPTRREIAFKLRPQRLARLGIDQRSCKSGQRHPTGDGHLALLEERLGSLRRALRAAPERRPSWARGKSGVQPAPERRSSNARAAPKLCASGAEVAPELRPSGT